VSCYSRFDEKAEALLPWDSSMCGKFQSFLCASLGPCMAVHSCLPKVLSAVLVILVPSFFGSFLPVKLEACCLAFTVLSNPGTVNCSTFKPDVV